MEWLGKNWKKVVWLLGAALSVGAGGAYMADCDGVGDALKQGSAIMKDAGEEPVAEPKPAE